MEQSPNLNLLLIFVRIAELRSFTAAAAALNLPKSTVSRAIKRLEAELKVPLLLRNTRIVELTPVGKRLFAASFAELAILADRVRAVLSETDQPTRLVRITAVEDMGAHLLPEVIGAFSKRYPLVRFELLLTNQQLNLVRDGVDIAVRVGELKQVSHRKRHAGSVAFILVGSSRYCERFPHITLQDLASHPLLVLPGYAQKGKTLHLVNGTQEARPVVSARATATNTAALLKLVQLDLGVGLLPEFLCRDGLAQGSLVRLCPGWHTPPKRVSLVYTAKQPREPVVKELGDCIYEHFRRCLIPT